MGAYYSGVPLNVYDIAPVHSQKVGTVLNICGTAQGLFSVLTVMLVMDYTEEFRNSWRITFDISFIISVICWILYIILGSGKRQGWDKVDKPKRSSVKEVAKRNTIDLLS